MSDLGVGEHVPFNMTELGLSHGIYCRRCGFLLVDRAGEPTGRAQRPCTLVRVGLR